MKTLLDLLNEIEEKQMNPIDEAETNMVDEIGKFFVVEKPDPKNSEDNTVEKLVFESNVLHFANQVKGGLAFDDVIGIYEQKSDARRKGTESLKEYDMQLKEMEDAMNEFREAKKGIDDKKKVAREKIKSLQ